ncbi:MAG: DNA repair protein RadA [Candidatus Promineofilum sp.]|nr:DNA repair protein RadA [Promineifilum sp.]MCW5865578.1 DNA repair protein RadA [Anaerolineae bacterium]
MAKRQTQYVCQACGRTTPVYMGRCPRCGEFDTMVEQRIEPEPGTGGRRSAAAAVSRPVRLREVEADGLDRLALPVQEFSRVLGGGLVPGSLILVGGDPGIGKSTLLLEVAGLVAGLHGPVLYISGEESARQIKMRADRLRIDSDDLFLVTETNLHVMMDHINAVRPVMTIVDSIQTTYDDNLSSSAGSVSQVRESAARLQDVAKSTGIVIVLVGHVTKEGAIAGPRVLEHIVDTVLYLEGDPFHRYRLLRSVKNRFGATSEVGVFEMVEQGMVEVTNPSEAFLAERQANAPGSAIAVTLEGTRPLLVEVQALASSTTFANPRRTPNGIDYNRLLLLTAVLTRRVHVPLHDKDVFVNVIGGLQITEPAADLAVALAIASSVKDRAIHADMAFLGEIGLSGELRAVSQLEPRLREAAKLGFRRCVVPRSRQLKEGSRPEGLEIIQCRTLYEAVDVALIK